MLENDLRDRDLSNPRKEQRMYTHILSPDGELVPLDVLRRGRRAQDA
jgi:hypothetical protein